MYNLNVTVSADTIAKRPLALAYVRVSTDEQVDSGASLDAQRSQLMAEADRRGWDIEFVVDAGYSGKSMDTRPGLKSAFARLDSGEAQVLLAQRVDRLSRSVRDFALLMERAQKKKWNVAALDLGLDTSTPSGMLMANILASFAEYERHLIGQRTREGLAQRRAEGVQLGRPARLSESTVARILSDRARGRGLTQISLDLASEGIPTAAGGRWHPSTVKRVLESEAARRLRNA